jgi:flagellar biosynthesis/type III secretory pathway chaperone
MLALREILENELEAVDQLTGLLDIERSLLEDNNHQSLGELLTKKNALLLNLNQLEQKRSQYVISQGFDGTPEQFPEFLLNSEPGKSLIPLVERLKDKLEDCFQKNRVNGGIAELSAYCIDHSLSILRGTTEQDSATYGPGGQKPSQSESQRTLAKA